MLWLLLVAPALTIDIGWTIAPECPDIIIDAPREIDPGMETRIIVTGAKRGNYTIRGEDGWMIKEGTTSGTVRFTPHKKYAGTTLLFSIQTGTPCAAAANATIRVTGQATSTPRMPSTPRFIPWLLAGISTVIAAVLIWRR